MLLILIEGVISSLHFHLLLDLIFFEDADGMKLTQLYVLSLQFTNTFLDLLVTESNSLILCLVAIVTVLEKLGDLLLQGYDL